tara:strand:- start:54 stop:524 length:471 start_codon:yes stop_codon:yes gene_type:complete
MKKIFLTALIFSVVSCSVPEVPMDSLVERNGITYQVNSDKPYSGKAIIYFANGQVDLINTYKKGKIIQQEAFQQNGTPLYKEVFDKNGTIIEEEYYHDNGQLRTTISCEGGIENDICPYEEYYEYYENGQLNFKGIYKNGEPVLEEEYYENGEKVE